MTDEYKRSRYTSKFMLGGVILAGFIMLLMGLFEETNNLIGYGLLLGAVVWNRIDSRSKSYRASWSVGAISGELEYRGDPSQDLDPGGCPPGGAIHRPKAPNHPAGGPERGHYVDED